MAMHFCQSGLALAISTGSTKRQCQALVQLAVIKTKLGDFSGAKEDAFESQRAAKLAGNLYTQATALRAEAIIWSHFGSYSLCISLLDQAINLLDLCGIAGGPVHGAIRSSQAEVHRCKSEYVDARNILIHILHDTNADHNPYIHAFALLNIAQVDVEIGGFGNDVQQNIHRAGVLFQKINYSLGIKYCDMFRAALDLQLGKFPAARITFQQYLRSTDPQAVTYCLQRLATVQEWNAADQITSLWPVIFLVHSVKSKQRLELHKALQFLGDVFRAQGDQETAISLFTVALDGFTQLDVHRSRAECMVRLGDISRLTGDEPKAVNLWETARPLFERSSQRKQLADLDVKLANLCYNHSPEVQQESHNYLSNIHAPTEHLKPLSDAESPNFMGIEDMENRGLEEKKALVLKHT
jgi:tetratricopeptide (TPR) repeat protein